MDDLISRQALIYAMCEDCEVFDSAYCRSKDPCPAVKTAMDFPNVDAVPVVHGRWSNEIEPDFMFCSICGFGVHNAYSDISDDYNYCPSCGSRMDLEEMIGGF